MLYVASQHDPPFKPDVPGGTPGLKVRKCRSFILHVTILIVG